jgi:HAD superfamily hydrolase (TIGR01457 family)
MGVKLLNSKTGDIISGMIFDLDGTIYNGNTAIPHAVDFITELQEHGIGVMFYTNRAHRTPEQIAEKLTEMNFQVTANQILTSALVTAHALHGKRVFCIGENPLTQALKSADITITENNPDYVVVGYVEDLKGAELTKAVQYITHGEALFVATNQDPYIIVDGKRVPENGAIVAAVQAAAGIKPVVYGKPNPAGIQLALQILQLSLEEVFIVGDSPATDIQCGINAGIRTALILSGVTSAQQALCSEAEWVVKDYKDLRSRVFV